MSAQLDTLVDSCKPLIADFGDAVIRRYRREDRQALSLLLSGISTIYPDGQEWLQDKLDEVERGKARARVAAVPCAIGALVSIAGVTIETPKADGRLKLSNLYVCPGARRAGVASALVDRLTWRWSREHYSGLHLTVDTVNYEGVQELFAPFGFRRVASLPGRYRTDRTELVLAQDR